MVTGLIDPVMRRAAQPQRGQAETIHLLRTTTKQLRALLRMLRPLISATTFEREDARLKAAADRVASGRDLAVARATLTMLAKAAPDARNRAALVRLRHSLHEHTTPSPERDPARAIGESARDLEHSGRALRRMRIAPGDWHAVAPGITDVYRRAQRRMKAAQKDRNDEAFHQWRIPAKRLSYQLRWIEPFWPKRFSPMIRHLHKLEEDLGNDHDVAVLRALLLSPPGGFTDAEAAGLLRMAAGRRTRRLRRRCLSLGKDLFEETPRSFGTRCRNRLREGPGRKSVAGRQ